MILTGFPALDALLGGIQERKNYLVYGDIGVGKTTFALHFLYQGLLAGEGAAIVTRRSAQTVFDHGRAFGMDLESFARTEDLIVLEYLPRVVENATRLRDEGQIFRELQFLLDKDPVRRLVFDPVTPLLATPSPSGAIFRARTVVQAFAELGATNLYMFDTPEGEDYLASCKDFVHGVLRFEAAAGQGGRCRLVLERFPGVRGAAQIDFEASPGVGLVEVAPVAAPGTGAQAGPSGQRRVLLVEPDPAQRDLFRGLLEKSYVVLEAEDGTDGLAKVAASAPDLVMIERDIEGVDGVAFCRTLRKNNINVPIVLVANQIRRARDRVEIMAAGADECLERPLDGRIVKLKIQNLLRRYDSSTDRLTTGGVDPSVQAGLDRDKTTSTTNLAYFYDRIHREANYAAENAISFGLVVLSLPEEATTDAALVKLAGSLIREYDLVYYGRHLAAVLLAETDEKGVSVFLRRFAERWDGTPAPTVQYRCFDRREDSYLAAKELIEGAAGSHGTAIGGPAGRA